MDIEKTLAERGQRYGDFAEHARITQNIKIAMMRSPNWHLLSPDQREALEMFAHKAGRVLNGDHNYHDSWHDMVGYLKLVADRLAPVQPNSDSTGAGQPEGAKSCVKPSLSEIAKRFVPQSPPRDWA